MSKRKWLYELTRTDENGFKETIVAWSPCKGWKVTKKIPYREDSMGRVY